MKKILKSLLALSLISSPILMTNQVLAVDDTNQTETTPTSIDTNYIEVEDGGARGIINIETDEVYIILSDNTLQLEQISSEAKEFTVPDQITAIYFNSETEEYDENRITTYKVTDINLQNVNQLTKINFSESVQKITSLSRSKITRLDIPENVTEISESAFRENAALEEVHLPSQLKGIEANTFYGCSSLNRVDLPENLEYIGNEAFKGDNNLESINLPKSVTKIGDYAFQNTGLKEMTLPDNLTTLGNASFLNCHNLKSIKFGENLKTIPKDAFRQCLALENIIIPEGITTIEQSAFENCYRVKNIELPSTLTSVGQWAFGFSYKIATVPYPSQLESIQYKYNGNSDDVKIPNFDKNVFKNNSNIGTVDLGKVTLSIRIMNDDTTSFETLKSEFEKNGFAFNKIELVQNVVKFMYGDIVIKESVNKGEKTVLPDEVTKGWYGFSGTIDENTKTIQLIEKTFNIDYDYSNGSMLDGYTNPDSFSYTDRDKELENPVKEGYEFLGWYVKSNTRSNARIYNVNQLSAGNKTLEARWAPLQNYITNLDIQTTDNQKPAKYTSKYYTNKAVKITFKVKVTEDPNPGVWYYGNFVTARNDAPIDNIWEAITPDEEGVYTITLNKPDKYIIKFKNICNDVKKIHDNVIEVIIDNVAPTISFRQSEDNTYFGYLFDVRDPTKVNVDGQEVKTGYALNYIYVNDKLVIDYSKDGLALGPSDPVKIADFVDKDTVYTVKAIDKAGNSTTETVTLKGVPSVDDVTLTAETLKTIGNIRDEFDKKVESGFFKDQDDLKKQIESRIVTLENRYNDLVEKAPIDKIIELSSAVTKDNVTTGNVELLKGLKQQLIEKYEAVKDKDNCPLTQDAYKKEIKRIDDVIAHHEKVMKEYNTAISSAETYIKTGCHLGNLKEGQTMITSLEKMLKTNSHNYTTEEVARINQNIVTIREMITLLQNAKDDLQECVDSFDKLDANKYTSESYAQLKEAYDDAVKALNDKNSTIEVLNEKLEAFKKQMNTLKANDVVVSDNNSKDNDVVVSDNNSKDNDSKDKTEDKKKKPIETGDSTDLSGLTYGLLASAGTIVYLSKKKKELNNK